MRVIIYEKQGSPTGSLYFSSSMCQQHFIENCSHLAQSHICSSKASINKKNNNQSLQITVSLEGFCH